jgi:Tol biopolymer transport system component
MPDNQHILYIQQSDDYRIIRHHVESADESVLYETSRFIDDLCVSPDGTGILFIMTPNVVMLDTASGDVRQLTDNNFLEQSPCWNRDGSRILFLRHNDRSAIYEMNSDGSNPILLYDGAVKDDHPVYAADERTLVLTLPDANGQQNLFWLPKHQPIANQLTTQGGYHPVWFR